MLGFSSFAEAPFCNIYNKKGLIYAGYGAYNYSGQSASNLLGRVLFTQNGTYSYSGQQATLLKNNIIEANQGAYTVTGFNADIGIFLGDWELETNAINTWSTATTTAANWITEVSPPITWN
jgi:hypothetical protein